MYNDFVLIGPKNDPVGAKGKDIVAALKAIKAKAAPFIIARRPFGTHAAELNLWKVAGIDIAKDLHDKNSGPRNCAPQTAKIQ